MKNLQIEIVISEGDDPKNATHWKTLGDVLVTSDGHIEAQKYPIDVVIASLEAVKVIKERLSNDI